MSEKTFRIEWTDYSTGAECMEVVDEAGARTCAIDDPLHEMHGIFEILDDEGNMNGINLLGAFRDGKYNAPRKATPQEVADMCAVDTALEFDEIKEACALISAFMFSKGAERKKLYNKMYRFGKAHGVTVPQLVNWFTTDIY